jgi:hypothetical protein
MCNARGVQKQMQRLAGIDLLNLDLYLGCNLVIVILFKPIVDDVARIADTLDNLRQ